MKASSFAAAAAAAAKVSTSCGSSSCAPLPGFGLQGCDLSSRTSAVSGIPSRGVPTAVSVGVHGSSVGVPYWGGRGQSVSSQGTKREASPPAVGVLGLSPHPSRTSRPPGWVRGEPSTAARVSERDEGDRLRTRSRQVDGDKFRSLLGSDGMSSSAQGTVPPSDGQKTPSAGGCSSTAASSSEAESGQPEAVDTTSSSVDGSKTDGRRASLCKEDDTLAKEQEGGRGSNSQSRPPVPARSGGRVRGYAEVLTSSPTTASSSLLLLPAMGEKFPALCGAAGHASGSREGDFETNKEGERRFVEREDMRHAAGRRASVSPTGNQTFSRWNGSSAVRLASGIGNVDCTLKYDSRHQPDGELCGAWSRKYRAGCDGTDGEPRRRLSNKEECFEEKMISTSRASPGDASLAAWKTRRGSGGDSSTREISEGARAEDEESNPGEPQEVVSSAPTPARSSANCGRAEVAAPPSLELEKGRSFSLGDGSLRNELPQVRGGSITKSDLRFFPISDMRAEEERFVTVFRSTASGSEGRETIDCMKLGRNGQEGHPKREHAGERESVEGSGFQWLSKNDHERPDGLTRFSGDASTPEECASKRRAGVILWINTLVRRSSRQVISSYPYVASGCVYVHALTNSRGKCARRHVDIDCISRSTSVVWS